MKLGSGSGSEPTTNMNNSLNIFPIDLAHRIRWTTCMRMRAWIFAVVGLLFTLVAGRAELRLHGLFTDNMVLQRDEPVYIYGWCDDDDTVTVTFRNVPTKAKVKDGKFVAKLKSLK